MPEVEPYSQEGSVDITHGQTKTVGRGLKCRAYKNSYWSAPLCAPNGENTRKKNHQYLTNVKSYLQAYAAKYPEKTKPQHYLGYCPVGFKTYSQIFQNDVSKTASIAESTDPPAEVFLNDIYQVCFQLYKILLADQPMAPLDDNDDGDTDSSNSLITPGLIFLYLPVAAREY